MVYSLTLFKSQFDNKTHRRMTFQSFEGLEDLLYKLSEQPKESKKDAELISPAIYESGTTRANKNVLAWAGWAAVDVDDHEFSGELENELRTRYGQHRFVCYSTASSRRDFPKFRLVFPLNRSVQSTEIKAFWFALNTSLGNIGDIQTKDLSRMYYIPANYAGSYNFIFSNPGDPLDVDALMAEHPFVEKGKSGGTFLDRLPPELAEQVILHRKSVMESKNNDTIWTSYHDCPFWPKRLAAEYQTISNTGWYHKMYQIMVSIAARALEKEYPITATQIAEMCKQFDLENGKWYENRPLEVEADRALEYAYRSV